MFKRYIARYLSLIRSKNTNASKHSHSYVKTEEKLPPEKHDKYKRKTYSKEKPKINVNDTSLSAITQLFLNVENESTGTTNEKELIPSFIGKSQVQHYFEEDDEGEVDLLHHSDSPDSFVDVDDDANVYADDDDVLLGAEGELQDFKEDIIAVPNLHSLTKKTISDSMKAIKSGTPNPRIPMSDITCPGCGAHFHCKDPSIPGYIPSERFTSVTKNQLRQSLCQRCNLMENYNICLNVRSTEEEFDKLITTINEDHSLIILVVDLTDIRNSIMSQFFKLIQYPARHIYVVGNKIDSIPMDETGYLKRIRTTLFKECENAGLNKRKNIKYVSVISAKTGYGIEDLISHLMVDWKYKGNVYLLGNTNVGKSTLFNALLQSDYCKSRAREVIHRASVSVWPGTTISTLKFPITNPKPWRLAMREKRVKAERTAIQQERMLQKSMVNQEESLRSKWKTATLSGYLGVTDFREDKPEIRKYEVPSFEMKDDSVVANVGRDHILNLPSGLEFDDTPSKQSNWLFDTPGVINQNQIINLMTPAELAALLPTEVVPPRVYLMKPGQTMFITAMGRIDYVEGKHAIFMTIHVTSNIKIKILDGKEADEYYNAFYGKRELQVPVGDADRLEMIPSLVGREFYLPESIGIDLATADIQLSSLGWVSVTMYKNEPIKLRAYTPGAKGLYLRQPALLPKIKSFRGKRIGGKQEYRVNPPKITEFKPK